MGYGCSFCSSLRNVAFPLINPCPQATLAGIIVTRTFSLAVLEQGWLSEMIHPNLSLYGANRTAERAGRLQSHGRSEVPCKMLISWREKPVQDPWLSILAKVSPLSLSSFCPSHPLCSLILPFDVTGS